VSREEKGGCCRKRASEWIIHPLIRFFIFSDADLCVTYPGEEAEEHNSPKGQLTICERAGKVAFESEKGNCRTLNDPPGL
jgi:hypothetical protein